MDIKLLLILIRQMVALVRCALAEVCTVPVLPFFSVYVCGCLSVSSCVSDGNLELILAKVCD